MVMARYAVIFVSERTEVDAGYDETDRELVELVRRQPGFAGVESIQQCGRSITVSYWESLESIRAWKELEAHRQAQQRGRNEWYRSYRIQVCEIQRDYAFDAGTADCITPAPA